MHAAQRRPGVAAVLRGVIAVYEEAVFKAVYNYYFLRWPLSASVVGPNIRTGYSRDYTVSRHYKWEIVRYEWASNLAGCSI